MDTLLDRLDETLLDHEIEKLNRILDYEYEFDRDATVRELLYGFDEMCRDVLSDEVRFKRLQHAMEFIGKRRTEREISGMDLHEDFTKVFKKEKYKDRITYFVNKTLSGMEVKIQFV